MFPARYFAPRYFAPRYWPGGGTAATVALGVTRTDPILRSAPEFATGSTILFTMQGLLMDARVTLDVRQESAIEFAALATEEWVPSAVPGTVVWHEVRGTVLEWWISEKETMVGPDGNGVVRFRAEPLHTLLADVGPIEHTVTGGRTRASLGGPIGGMSAKNYVSAYVLPWLVANGIDYVGHGSYDSTERIEITWDNKNPQQIIKALADELGYEWQLRRDEATEQLLIDIVAVVGASEPTARATEGVNLVSLKRRQDRETLASAVRPVGRLASGSEHRGDITFNAYRVVSVATDDVVVEAHNGGLGPAQEAGQWANHYLEAGDGTYHLIEGSVVTSSTQTTFELEAGAGASFAADDDCRIVRDSSGTGITEIVSPGTLTLFGRVARPIELDIDGHRNWVRNPHYDDWTTAPTLYSAQFVGSHVSTSSLSLDGLAPNGTVFEVGDSLVQVGRINDQMRFHRITVGGTVTAGAVSLTIAGTLSASDNEFCLLVTIANESPALSQRLPASTDHPTFFRRPREVLSDLSCNIDGTQTLSATAGLTLNLKGLTEGDVIYPGDLIHETVGNKITWAGELVTVPAGGLVTILCYHTGTSTSFTDNNAVTIIRPIVKGELVSAYMPAMPRHHVAVAGSPGRLSSLDFTVNPSPVGQDAEGNTLYEKLQIRARCSAISSAAEGWSAAAGDLDAPRLRLIESSSEVLGADADDWAPAAIGTRAFFDIEAEIALTAQKTYSLEFQPAAKISSAAEVTNSGPFVFPHWIMAYIGDHKKALPVHGAAATRLIQKGQVALTANNDWASTYTCDMIELAEELEVSPAVIRASIGALIFVNSPELGVLGALRIEGFTFNMHEPQRMSVILDTRFKLMTKEVRKQKAGTLFGRVEIETASGEELGQTFIPQKGPPTVPGVVRAGSVKGSDLDSAVAPPIVVVE